MAKRFYVLFLLGTLLLAVAPGCRFLSSEEDMPPYFIATIGEVDLDGTSTARLAGGDLQIWAQMVDPDSSFRFLQITLRDFDGEGAYPIAQRTGSYGIIEDDDGLLRFGLSSGRPEDIVEVSGYDADAGIVRGSLFFYGQALVAFDGVARGGVFTAEARFRTELH